MPIVRNQISVDHPTTLHSPSISLSRAEPSCPRGRPRLLSLPIALSRPSRIDSSDLHTNDNSVPLFICSGRSASRWSCDWTVATLSITSSLSFTPNHSAHSTCLNRRYFLAAQRIKAPPLLLEFLSVCLSVRPSHS